MRETRGGVDFFDLGKDLRTDGDDGGLSERVDKRRREEVIDGKVARQLGIGVTHPVTRCTAMIEFIYFTKGFC
jgi:hypothetical protein